MLLIDAHCHASPLWFEPVEPLIGQMDRHGVEKAVLTQVLGQFDNGYQQDCMARYPGRFASVGAVDGTAADAIDQVRYWASLGMAGLRLRPVDPVAIWQASAELGLAISCGGPAGSIISDEFRALATTLPALTIVLEQLGGWTRPDCDRTPETWRALMALADFPNIMLKIPTLGQIAPRQIGKPLPADGPVLDAAAGAVLIEALNAFGAERLMWGSDYPVVSSREGYANALHWTRDLFAARTGKEVAAIFGGNAARIFFGAPA